MTREHWNDLFAELVIVVLLTLMLPIICSIVIIEMVYMSIKWTIKGIAKLAVLITFFAVLLCVVFGTLYLILR